MNNIQKGDTVFWVRCIFDEVSIIPLKVRTAEEDFCVGLDTRTKQAQFFGEVDVGQSLFTSLEDAEECAKMLEEISNGTE